MRTINNISDLQESIKEMEALQAQQKQAVLDQVDVVKQSLKPVNILKNTFRDFKEDTETRNSLLQSATGIGLGLLSKSLFVGRSASLVKHLLGDAVESGVRAISKNDKIKAYATAIYRNLFKTKEKQTEE